MHWIDGTGHVKNSPNPGENSFVDGDPTSGVRGTVLTAKWLNDLQRNLFEVIKQGDTGSSESDPRDLYRAIEALSKREALAQAVPVGTIAMFGGEAAPAGWLICDGSAESRTTYAALFAAIDTKYGLGNGTTTFNLPDLRSRMPLGVGAVPQLSPRSLGEKGGAETHTLTIAEMPLHGHPVLRSNFSQTGAETKTIGGIMTHNGAMIVDPAFTGTPASPGGQQVGGEGGNTAHNNMPPFLVVNFIIKH